MSEDFPVPGGTAQQVAPPPRHAAVRIPGLACVETGEIGAQPFGCAVLGHHAAQAARTQRAMGIPIALVVHIQCRPGPRLLAGHAAALGDPTLHHGPGTQAENGDREGLTRRLSVIPADFHLLVQLAGEQAQMRAMAEPMHAMGRHEDGLHAAARQTGRYIGQHLPARVVDGSGLRQPQRQRGMAIRSGVERQAVGQRPRHKPRGKAPQAGQRGKTRTREPERQPGGKDIGL